MVAKRSGKRLLISWNRVKGARGYEVRVSLPRDGRRLLFFPAGRKHGLKVKGIEGSDNGRITVAAIGADLKTGKPGKAKLRQEKRRHKHRRRR